VEALAGMLAGLAVLLFCWPFLQNRSRAMRGRRPMQHAWDRRRKWYQALQPYLGIEAADLLCQQAGRPGGLKGAGVLTYQGAFGWVAGGLPAIGLMLLARHGRTQRIPLGPYLAAAGMLALFYGKPLVQAYLGWPL